jgi:arginine N-succinyltransferase
MLVIRPVRKTDLDLLLKLADLTGFGLTTLPRDPELLAERIFESEQSFSRMHKRPRGDSYLFVMEDTASQRVIGTCGIVSKVGGFEPFYAYRLQTTVHYSEMLNVRKNIQTLTLVAEHNGPAEIGSLFLHPDYRRDGNGRVLSLSRFLFVAEHLQRFEPVIIAEMRGVIDEQGRSHFWDAVGKHFFEIEFPKADYLSMVNKKFIADLMPRHPIYVPLLPAEAQAVIGKVHVDTRPALALLESEGFQITDMVDIFEAGPVVSCKRDDIRTVSGSVRSTVEEIVSGPLDSPVMHLLNPQPDCRAGRGAMEFLSSGGVRLDKATAQGLELHIGDALRFAAPRGNAPATPRDTAEMGWP